MNEVEARISRALADRAAQRPFVEHLTETWEALSDRYAELVESMRALDTALAGNPAVPVKDRPVIDEVLAQLRPPPGGGPAPADELALRLDDVRGLLATLLGRVTRETVNIGVIGVTKAGKSTLLRTITDLPETVIPTTRFRPTTASASRIYHTPGAPSAVLDLHTWESFRDSYLEPLHAEAKLGPPPASPEDFRHYRYAAPGTTDSGAAGTDDVVRKLIAAQSSLDSYLGLLRHRARSITVDFADLRAFVAYPDVDRGDSPVERPYHAVRSVRIEQRFLEGATKLGFIDLPGAGEAGLDVDRHFVQRVKHEIDLLLMTKRPLAKDAGWFGPDSDVLRLADTARGGAALEDYFMVLLNRDVENDPSGEFFASAMEDVRRVTVDRSIQVLAASAGDRADVVENVLVPALGHLATKLAKMDRAAIDAVLEESGTVVADVRQFADDLVARTERFARNLPHQEFLLRDQVDELLNQLTIALFDLRSEYDDVAAAGSSDDALAKGIADAVVDARKWVASGFGRGGRAQWLAAIDGAYKRGFRDATQDEYFAAKAEISECFARIDTSLEQSVQELLVRVADVLRTHLTPTIVPETSGLKGLQEIALDRRAVRLNAAITQLGNLRMDYGSIVLRVTRPIIREIDPDDPAAGSRTASATGRQLADAALDIAIDATAAALGSPVAVSPAVRAGYRWVTDANGVRHRELVTDDAPPLVPAAQTTAARPVAPPSTGSAAAPTSGRANASAANRRSVGSAEALYDELTRSVTNAIDELERALLREARVMVKALAAAVDKFFDSVLRTNEISRDYELLCGPDRRTIWPQAFDGGAARLAADLSRTSEYARHVIAQSEVAADFRMTLRLPQGSPM